jgi:catechol 2,3-dioxygenase-like lactoylglutathione lyase family enzyme
MPEIQSPLGTVDAAVTSLYVADLDAAVRWYETVLGLLPLSVANVDDVHPHAAFHLGGSLVVLEPIEAALERAEPAAENTTINLLVRRDASQVRTELLRRGVRCSEMADSPHYSSFLMRDLDGNRFYISQPVSHEAQRDVADAGRSDPS